MNIRKFAIAGRLIALATFGLILSNSGWAQTTGTQAGSSAQSKDAAAAPAAALPTVDQILNHYIEATGGRDAWKKLTTRVSKGTLDIPAMNMSGSIEIHEKAPNESLATVMIAGNAFVQGYDGKTAWSNDPQNGLRELSDGELEEAQRDADFYHALDLKTLYKSLTIKSKEKIGDSDAYLVEGATGDGDPDVMYFDATSGLLIRLTGQRHTPEGAAPTQIDLSDYRDVDGVKLPFSVHQSVGDVAYTISFSEVQHNVEMDDAQFAKPAAQ